MNKHISTDTEDNESLIPDEDAEYERQLAEEERHKREEIIETRRKIAEEKKKREKEEREERDRRIAQDKLDLMKMKAGIADEEEEIKEVHEEKRELHGWEKVANIWYHDKIWICFGLFTVIVAAFLIYDAVSRVQPDIEIMMICDNAAKSEESRALLGEELAKYVPDLNGDGKVKVTVMDCSLNDYVTDITYTNNSQKFFANLQQGRIIMVITDSNTDPDLQALMVDTLKDEIPDNDHIDEQGLSLNYAFLAKDINCEKMPNDIHLCLRRPVSTLDDSLEEMQENYDTNLAILKDIAAGFKETAEATGDKGLETEPVPLQGAPTESAKAEDSAKDAKDSE